MEQKSEMGEESLLDRRNHLSKGPVMEGRVSMKTWEKVNVGGLRWEHRRLAGHEGARPHKVGYCKNLVFILIPIGIFQEL